VERLLLALAIVLAVGGVSSVAFFADRVRQALTREAHQVLGADVLLNADHPWSAEMRDEIARRGLSGAESVSFVSMTRAGDEKLFLQALIQLAAACVHLTRGNAGPGIRLLSLSGEKLARFGDDYAGVRVDLLGKGIVSAQEQLRAGVAPGDAVRTLSL